MCRHGRLSGPRCLSAPSTHITDRTPDDEIRTANLSTSGRDSWWRVECGCGAEVSSEVPTFRGPAMFAESHAAGRPSLTPPAAARRHTLDLRPALAPPPSDAALLAIYARIQTREGELLDARLQGAWTTCEASCISALGSAITRSLRVPFLSALLALGPGELDVELRDLDAAATVVCADAAAARALAVRLLAQATGPGAPSVHVPAQASARPVTRPAAPASVAIPAVLSTPLPPSVSIASLLPVARPEMTSVSMAAVDAFWR